jgi:predicted amidophosphoribosyltransferase
MITCPNCKTSNEDWAMYCQNCGSSLEASKEAQVVPPETKNCRYCGAEINYSAIFCKNCGRDLRIEPVQQSTK